jgi:NADP-dependent 3-hydroxy acid dehydrogenase YdfG
MYLMGPVDLKKKYKATWALVTGAGTGIGKSLAETMAAQGLNIVLVSLPDKFLNETTEELRKAYPNLEFRAVPAKFDHNTDYMPAIIEVGRLHFTSRSILIFLHKPYRLRKISM